MTEKKDIKSMPMETLAVEMEALGVKKFRTAQLYDWMHVKLSRGFDEMSNLPKDFREKCKELYTYTALIPVEVQSPKSTARENSYSDLLTAMWWKVYG